MSFKEWVLEQDDDSDAHDLATRAMGMPKYREDIIKLVADRIEHVRRDRVRTVESAARREFTGAMRRSSRATTPNRVSAARQLTLPVTFRELLDKQFAIGGGVRAT